MDITPENVAHRVGVTRHQAAEGYGCNCLWKVQGQDHSNYREDTDGKIKAWLYDTIGSRVDYTAPGNSSTRMAYRADGTRIAFASAVKVETLMTSMFGAANTSVSPNILDRATPMPSTVMMWSIVSWNLLFNFPGFESIADLLRIIFNESGNPHAKYYRVAKTSRIFSWCCFNHGVAMEDFAKKRIGFIILTSSTLSPMDSLAEELNL
nr:regulator of telomere elongation helicase 1 isoform X1 [Tanacetum cinerariifolium]